MSAFIFCPTELVQRLSHFFSIVGFGCGFFFFLFDLCDTFFSVYGFMNNMDTTTLQPQGQTEKMLNYKVPDLGAFSVHEQKS